MAKGNSRMGRDLAKRSAQGKVKDVAAETMAAYGSKRSGDNGMAPPYERHMKWSQANGHNPDTVAALSAHEKSGGLSRREANKVADENYIGGGESNWRSQGHLDAPSNAEAKTGYEGAMREPMATPDEAAQAIAANSHPWSSSSMKPMGQPASDGSVSRRMGGQITDHRGRML